MCKNCGCSGGHHHDELGNGHHHDDHEGEHVHYDEHGNPYTHSHKTVALETAVLAANDAEATKNRRWLNAAGVTAFNLISSPGAGKTALLERTLKELLRAGVKCAVIVGDQYGELDAERIRRTGVPVTQIETGESCHLNAAHIGAVLDEAVPKGTSVLFIENVGNLVCPTAFDLGERMKIALLSSPEGEEKPLKYPALFAAASLVLLTKADLDDVLGYNRVVAVQNVYRINPDARIIEISARTGQGMAEWIEWLLVTTNERIEI